LAWERGRLARLDETALSHTCGRDARAPSELCQAEIQDLRRAPAGDKDVGRLDVAVDDALLVRRVQRIGNLDCEVQQGLDP